MAFQKCQPGRPISIVHFHGTADRLNPYEGGEGPRSGTEFVSVKDNIQFWVQADGCPAQAQVEQNGSVVHESYAPCEQGESVELFTIQNGEHAWPGGESVSAEIGEPTKEISATSLMWEFFEADPLLI
jgi:polyhydroxybutyrate depolymerase